MFFRRSSKKVADPFTFFAEVPKKVASVHADVAQFGSGNAFRPHPVLVRLQSSVLQLVVLAVVAQLGSGIQFKIGSVRVRVPSTVLTEVRRLPAIVDASGLAAQLADHEHA